VPKCLFIKSKLSSGGIDNQMDHLMSRYDIDLHIVDRNEWLQSQLRGEDFVDLDLDSRKNLCKNLKREPLLDFIKLYSLKIWISGIRQDQTKSRSSVKFMEVTDLSVIKISPLYAWSKDDAADLMLGNGLQLNHDYFDLCKLLDSKECGLHY
jgi:3'-phosphoadenosine 5'-phosphosulfate sulfotransferase (PAPS reductase)/FAD synthetase